MTFENHFILCSSLVQTLFAAGAIHFWLPSDYFIVFFVANSFQKWPDNFLHFSFQCVTAYQVFVVVSSWFVLHILLQICCTLRTA